MKVNVFFQFALAVSLFALPSASYAACSAPYGEAGDMFYNGNDNMMQFCDNTDWIAMGGGGGGGGFTDKIEDADGDTMVQVEEAADEDNIRFDTAGTERMVIDENGVLYLNGMAGGAGVGGNGATVSGTAGAVQFSNGTTFASDVANFFWDDTANKLGIGTNSLGANETLAVHLAAGRGARIGTVGNDGSTALLISAVSATQIGLIVRGAAAQTETLQRWQDSAGTTLASVSAAGVFSGSGASLTNLNASNLASGTVPVARLGSSGTPSATTYLRGDNTWQTPSGGAFPTTVDFQIFTASGTWTKPGSGTTAYIQCWGGGGGGRNNVNDGGGGGGGAYGHTWIALSSLGATVAVTVGGGGAAGATGGTSTFGAHLSVVGGSPGAATTGGAGGAGSVAAFNGGAGGGVDTGNGTGLNGLDGIYGGGGGAGFSNAASWGFAEAGRSVFGGGGGGNGKITIVPMQPGGGGRKQQAGAAGMCQVTVY